MSLEVFSPKVVVKWRVEGIKELLKKAEKENVIHEILENPKYCGPYLSAKCVEADRKRGSGDNWFLSVDGESLRTELSQREGRLFNSKGPSWGWEDALDRALLEKDAVSAKDAFVVQCTLESVESDALPTFAVSDAALVSNLYNNLTYADVAFRVNISNSLPSYLLSTKLVLIERCPHFKTVLTSGFSESAAVSLDPQALSVRPQNVFEGDRQDFQAFENSLSLPARSLLQIEIQECSYSTFNSLLSFLHSGEVVFLPSTSNFLIAFQDEPRTQPDLPYSIAERDTWLSANAESKNDTLPCNPHALYRLADRYLLDDLKKLAKNSIVKGLTVQNAAYEAFSGLSRDSEDVQKDIVEFVLKNWKEVKLTRAWSQAIELLEEGQLSGGGTVFRRILDGLQA
ncbi:hypothetical protein JCM10213_007980 [Rhodosporidiobolus nylandii]